MTAVEWAPTGVRRWTSRVPRDVLLLIGGALLALSVEEFRDARHRRARTRESINSIRSEIRANILLVAKAREHHAFLVDTLQKLADARRFPDKGIYTSSMFAPANVTNVAWSLARESGTLADVPLTTVLLVATAYDMQDRYQLLGDGVAATTLEQARREGVVTMLRDHFAQFIPLEADFRNREGGLLRRYTVALIQLDRLH
jgi:hypothetical protein